MLAVIKSETERRTTSFN